MNENMISLMMNGDSFWKSMRRTVYFSSADLQGLQMMEVSPVQDGMRQHNDQSLTVSLKSCLMR